MIKLLTHKIFSTSLSLLVLFSTMSFTVEKHYCGNTLVDVSVFTEVQKCLMESLEKESEFITKKPCCKDTVDLIVGQDELKVTPINTLDLVQEFFLTSYFITSINFFEGLPKKVIQHKNYSPPDLIIDINIIDQVFLI